MCPQRRRSQGLRSGPPARVSPLLLQDAEYDRFGELRFAGPFQEFAAGLFVLRKQVFSVGINDGVRREHR